MRFDFSGVPIFWRVTDALSRDIEPNDELWHSLFDTPAYRALTASEFSADFFKQCWRLAFRPGLRSENPPPGQLRFIQHYRQVVQAKEELEGFLEEMARSPDLYRSAVDMAMRHLPPGDYGDDPRVAFAVFDLDGRGYCPIVIDPLLAMTSGEALMPFLAHEFHHHYMCQLTGLQLGTSTDDRTALEWVVDQVHLEGLADMVNVDAEFEQGTVSESLADEVEKTPQFLRFMDTQLRSLGKHPDEASSIGEKIKGRLAASGHPVGYYMARMIRDQLGKTRLLDTCRDPLLFFRAYCEAEEHAGLASNLSAEGLKVLERSR